MEPAFSFFADRRKTGDALAFLLATCSAVGAYILYENPCPDEVTVQEISKAITDQRPKAEIDRLIAEQRHQIESKYNQRACQDKYSPGTTTITGAFSM